MMVIIEGILFIVGMFLDVFGWLEIFPKKGEQQQQQGAEEADDEYDSWISSGKKEKK